MRGAGLFPDHPVRGGVAGELRHPGQGRLVFQVHPVPLAFVDLHEVLVPLRIVVLQLVQLLTVLAWPTLLRL